MALKIYVNREFVGHWPVGTSAVIAARDRGHAKRLLLATLPIELAQKNRDLELDTFEQFDSEIAKAVVLQDGDY